MRQIFAVPLIIAIGLTGWPSHADTSRGCKARWEIRSGASVRAFGHFEARGSCRNSARANDCRRAARKYAQDCFWSHWGARWDDRIRNGTHRPSHCLGRGGLGVRNYRLTDLKRGIEQQACSIGRSTPFTVTVVGVTYDGKRCDSQTMVSASYTITGEMCGKQ